MKHLFLSTLYIGLMLSISASYAAIGSNVLDKAETFLEQGNSIEAFNLLKEQNKTTAQEWFLFASAAHRIGSLEDAERGYRQVLSLDPNSGRAKLELASVLAEQQKWVQAKRLLNDVRAENPPERVMQNIDRFLSVIEDTEQRYAGWRIRSTAEVIYDSNVNRAPSNNQVTLFGLPFTLSPDALAQEDFAYRFNAEVDHVKKINSHLSWQTYASLSWTDYFTIDAYDQLSINGSAGPVFQLDEKTIFSLPVTTNTSVFTDQGEVFSASVGIAPQLRRQLAKKVTLNLDSSVSFRHFVNNNERDTIAYSFSPNLDFQTCGDGTLRVGGSLGVEDSDLDIFSYDAWSMNASLFCSVGENLALSVYGSFGDNNYRQREAAFAEVRREQRTTIGATMNYSLKATGLDVILSGNYTYNDANLPIYTYDRFQGSASFRKRF